MIAKVVLPTSLRASAGGSRELSIDGATVGEVLERLEVDWPQLGRRLRDERGVLRRHVRLYLESSDIFDLAGLTTPITAGARLHVVPAISGGSWGTAPPDQSEGAVPRSR